MTDFYPTIILDIVTRSRVIYPTITLDLIARFTGVSLDDIMPVQAAVNDCIKNVSTYHIDRILDLVNFIACYETLDTEQQITKLSDLIRRINAGDDYRMALLAETMKKDQNGCITIYQDIVNVIKYIKSDISVQMYYMLYDGSSDDNDEWPFNEMVAEDAYANRDYYRKIIDVIVNAHNDKDYNHKIIDMIVNDHNNRDYYHKIIDMIVNPETSGP